MTCSIDVEYDYSPSGFQRDKNVIARKEHKCYECGDIIKKGDEYEKVVGCWDGRFSEYKTCSLCMEIRNQIFCTWAYGHLWNDLYDYTDGGDLDYSMIDGLSVEAIDKIEKYFNWNEED